MPERDQIKDNNTKYSYQFASSHVSMSDFSESAARDLQPQKIPTSNQFRGQRTEMPFNFSGANKSYRSVNSKNLNTYSDRRKMADETNKSSHDRQISKAKSKYTYKRNDVVLTP